MTRKEKVNALEWYCDHCGDTCDKCELKNMYDKKTDEFTNNYSCAFDEMDDKMLDKIYSWYKELDLAACQNRTMLIASYSATIALSLKIISINILTKSGSTLIENFFASSQKRLLMR